MLRIGIVVGEPSGDALAADLISAIREIYPDVRFEGILGPRLVQMGGFAHFPMSCLSVMGITEVILEYPELASIRNRLKHHFLNDPPDVFIGVDAPDFNLTLEEQLRNAGIKTIHYVSPSVWAWRRGRIKKVARSVDKLLTLFPFETEFYKDVNLDVECVGHPLADSIPLEIDTSSAKKSLNITPECPVIALMPGSREKELARLVKPFLETALLCHEQNKNIVFISNLVNEDMQTSMQLQVDKYVPELPIQIYTGRSRQVLQACDVALLASGTITLEAMLLKKPMVIGYALSPLSFFIIRSLVSSRWAGLPNIIAQDSIVPEYYQGKVSPKYLAPALMHWLTDESAREKLVRKFSSLHRNMRLGASHKAASAVIELCKSHSVPY